MTRHITRVTIGRGRHKRPSTLRLTFTLVYAVVAVVFGK